MAKNNVMLMPKNDAILELKTVSLGFRAQSERNFSSWVSCVKGWKIRELSEVSHKKNKVVKPQKGIRYLNFYIFYIFIIS
jgi:hypothetical protein